MTILELRARSPRASAQNLNHHYSAYGEEDFNYDYDDEEGSDEEEESITPGSEENEEFDEETEEE